jgi:hypothetical protein
MHSAAGTRSPTRWVVYVALWLLLSCVFASQLFLAGYVTPWSRAFASEAVYWLSWGAMLPAVFGWCRRLRDREFATRVVGLAAGAVIAVLLEPLVYQAIVAGQASTRLCFGECDLGRGLSPPHGSCGRRGGVNPFYAGFGSRGTRPFLPRCAIGSCERQNAVCCTRRSSKRCAASSIRIFCSIRCTDRRAGAFDPGLPSSSSSGWELLQQVRSIDPPGTDVAEEIEPIRATEIEQMRPGGPRHLRSVEALELRARASSCSCWSKCDEHGIASRGTRHATIRAHRGRSMQIELPTRVRLRPPTAPRVSAP